MNKSNSFIIALENLRSLYNVGSIIRTSEFFGFYNVALIGYTAKDEFSENRINQKLKKTALSSFDMVSLQRFSSLKEVSIKYPMHRIVCIENNTKNTIDFELWTPSTSSIIVFGNEPEGLSDNSKLIADEIVELKRFGTHPSLNVATVAGIVLHKLANHI